MNVTSGGTGSDPVRVIAPLKSDDLKVSVEIPEAES